MTTPIESAALHASFHEPLRRFLSTRVPSSADVDDVLQDVFVRLAERGGDFERIEHVSGYLFRLARSAIADLYRARGAHDAVSVALGEEDAEATDSTASPRVELAGCLAPIIERMNEPYREAIVLTELEGLTQLEAARRVGLSLPGMKSRVQRGREQLRELVLACCDVELDRRRSVSHFESKPGGCGCSSR